MGYVFRDQHGVMTVQNEATINKPKEIRFITSGYNDLFKIPDSGQILIHYEDGRIKAFPCKYLDDYHLMVGHNAFHICEFAERMEAVHARVEPFPEKRVIWSDMNLDLKDWEKDLKGDYPDLDDDGLTEKMYEINSEYLGDEKINLNIQCGEDIIAIADIGRWNGRFSGYKLIESGYIKDCLESCQDMNEWYVDREGEFRSTQVHHDGHNYIYYRKFKADVSYDDRDELLGKIYEGTAAQQDIDKLTEKLGPIIGKVYGWEFPTEKEPIRTERDAR